MKRITIKSGTWHHRLATVYSTVHNDDICAYSRAVLAGFLKGVLIVVVATTVLYPVADEVLCLASGLPFTDGSFQGVVGGVLVFIATVAIMAAIFFAIEQIRRRFPRHCREPEPSVIGEMYRSWRDKYCARIQFTADP